MAKRIDRGEVWAVDPGYVVKVRPCLVLSIPPTDVYRALATLIPCTTGVRGSRFEVGLDIPFLDRVGAFDAQNLTTVSTAKFVKKLGSLTTDQMGQVEQAVRLWLGL